MERFFILDKFNTWYDWHLILTKKEISDAEPKTNYITLDGMSGTLDLSEALTGEITYDDRTIKATFWTDYGTYKDRDLLLRKITSSLHGKKIKIIEPDDETHYFIGRAKITSKQNTLPYLEFSIEIMCEPWRYAIDETERKVDINTSTGNDVIIYNYGAKTLCPVITVTHSVKIEYNGITTALNKGSYKVSSLKLRQGVNVVSVSGRGSVTFTYREADL